MGLEKLAHRNRWLQGWDSTPPAAISEKTFNLKSSSQPCIPTRYKLVRQQRIIPSDLLVPSRKVPLSNFWSISSPRLSQAMKDNIEIMCQEKEVQGCGIQSPINWRCGVNSSECTKWNPSLSHPPEWLTIFRQPEWRPTLGMIPTTKWLWICHLHCLA